MMEVAQIVTEEQQEIPEDPRGFKTLAPFVDLLSKAGAVFAIALYAAGFLVVSLHYSRYGFVGTNPFRPRVVAAGVWLFFFIATPLVCVKQGSAIAGWSWARLAAFSFPYYYGCVFLSLVASQGFSFPTYPVTTWHLSTLGFPPPYGVVRWWWLVGAALVVLALVLLMESKNASRRVPAAVASLLLAVFYVQSSARELFIANRFSATAVSLWFFVVSVVVILQLKARHEKRHWENVSFLLLGVVLAFAWLYYPHIKAAWGGGTPVDVIMFFAKDAPISPNQAASVRLIDESDTGFYILAPNESRAIYVRRDAVVLVYFSNKFPDSGLVQGTK
jgi:hypothetical protein